MGVPLIQDLVLLQTPHALLLVAAALALRLYDRRTHVSRGILTWMSTGLAILGVAVLLLAGATLREGVAVLLFFLLLSLPKGVGE